MSAPLMDSSANKRRADRSERRLEAQTENVERLEREIRAIKLLARQILDMGTVPPEDEEQPDAH